MQISDVLTIFVAVLVFVILILILVYWNISRKEKQNTSKNANLKSSDKNSSLKHTKTYTIAPMESFMEFDKIEDSMIVQDGGKRYLMLIECEGINYDLMSEIEKTSVEQGFVQFLNTLRHPIQLYVQTRTINIGNSIENYNSKVDTIKHELDKKQMEYNKMLQNGNYNQKDLQDLKMEIARAQNMYDYGTDIIKNIEKMSLNKNVLRKHYYIIIPYYTSELGNELLGEEEKRNMVFSELYARAQSIIRTLSACSVKGRVMDSTGIAELLYVAYNRDEAEVFGIDRALRSGYNELYATAPDVLDKRMEAINKAVEEKALEAAQNAVNEVKTEKQKIVEKREKSFDKLVQEMAEIILKENEQYIGKDVAEKAVKRIKNESTKEKEVSKDVKKEKTTRTRRVKQ